MDNLTAPDRPLFAHLPEHQAGPTFNRFLNPVRDGLTTEPKTIVQLVISQLRIDLQRLGSWNFHEKQAETLRQILFAIQGHLTEALALAQQAVDYHAMTPEDLAAYKASRAARWAAQAEISRRVSMARKSPTVKQLAYLKKLGCPTIPVNRWHAAQLIDERVGKDRVER
jgi:hypothetical protein